MTKDEQQRLVERAYALVGNVATGFSALEFHLQFLLSVLISGKVASPQGLLVLRQKTFAQKIQLLKDLVSLNFQRNSDLRRQGEKLVEGLNKLREKRNLYVHGYWIINYEVIASTGGVRCSDTKWRFDKEQDSWKSMESQDISLEELQRQIVATVTLSRELYSFNNEVVKGLTQDQQKSITKSK